ncbi:vWA domain-containing protein [Neisseria elongata]|uniref:VWA domain-containing protein n=1 Tax=Neisseria elongata subsp. nitroreducens TaxID=90367 RepID=A0A9X0ZUQ9_NEIEL|nr:VWA domain-containing protein [Neisseria elongata]MBS9340853.1 VWA domain-containing protein [Neisseria elongata subsp. nitroreducens]
MKNYSNIPARKHFLLNITTVLTVAALTACQPASPSYESGMQKNSAAKKDLALDGAAEKPIPAEAPAAVAYSPAAVYDVQETAPHVTNTERYQKQPDQPVKAVAQEPVSTFSIDVDTGSYANVRRFLNDGGLPPEDAVRIEEIVNYFPYNYPLPTGTHPFAIHTQTVDSPWQPEAKLIKIGIQAQDLAKKELPPANLVFLVDVSGSMDEPDKLPLVKKTLRILTEQLRPQDKVTLITYASGEELVLPPTSGDNKDEILRAINKLQAGGSTAGESALKMAYEQAQKAYVKNGINRILLATDGDFNVGVSSTDALKSMVAEKRKSGISLTTLGFGTGNYNEDMMEQIADAGDGNYSYIDNEKEAKKVLQHQLTSTLATVAQDVKIQVEFNPATVKEYRLVGYTNRTLRNEDFNNDKVDAGDIGSGHSVTAIYEIIPQGKQGWLNDSRYQKALAASGGKNEYAFVKVRYKLPGQSTSKLIEQAVPAVSIPLAQADEDTRLALAAASYAQALRGGEYNGKLDWDTIEQMAKQAKGKDPFGLQEEFVELVKIAKSLSSKRVQEQ